MSRASFVRSRGVGLVGICAGGAAVVLGALLLWAPGAGWAADASSADARQLGAPAASPPAGEITLKGECTFGKRKDTFVARLTPDGKNTYKVVYDANWNGKKSTWKGAITSDLAGDIKGEGTSNATFDFSGKFVDGVAKCDYKERGGRGRSGTLTLTR